MTLYLQEKTHIGGARKDTVIKRLEENLENILKWANKYGLMFSIPKCIAMSLKGGHKKGYGKRFGTGQDASTIPSENSVRYRGIHIDTRRSFWTHIENLSEKNVLMYRRF